MFRHATALANHVLLRHGGPADADGSDGLNLALLETGSPAVEALLETGSPPAARQLTLEPELTAVSAWAEQAVEADHCSDSDALLTPESDAELGAAELTAAAGELQLELELAQLEGQLEAELAQLVGQGLRVQVERCSRVDETVMVVTLVDE